MEAINLARKFGRTSIFRDINFSVAAGESLCVTGPNGSGKSTLLRILAGLLSPTTGKVTHTLDRTIPKDAWLDHTGYTGPLVNPYDELTALEHIRFAGRRAMERATADSFLTRFDLARHRDKKVRYYSSGMKQRLKIILAFLNDPPVLILDEPSTNLDARGKDILHTYIDSIRSGKIIIIATNDPAEERLCGGGIQLGQ
ncbi:MAG: ABC transporter ATP-binding protein [Spirochaetes bacterium]|nr:ABC transporter ATP-binding protein [Spirochaetota bacterium]